MSNTTTYTGFEFEAEGFPAIAIINKDLSERDKQKDYSTVLFIEIVPDAYNDYGHPEQAEYDYLVEMEKKMIDYLEGQTQTVHVGHVTMYRLLQIIFYTKEAEKAEGFLNYFLSTIERQTSLETEQDPEWENVSAFYELLKSENGK